MGGYYANSEERTLLKSHNFSLRPLATAGHLTLWKLFTISWHPIAVFWFTLIVSIVSLRLTQTFIVNTIRTVGLLVLLSVPFASMAVLTMGVAAAKWTSRIRWSAVTYWSWWPFWGCTLCAAAATLGLLLGDWLWLNRFAPHVELDRLQAYSRIDPNRVAGERLQDAGLVTFDASAGIDRARGGCFVNGETFCVAPILQGGELPEDGSDVPETGVYDFFMTGTNCCSCDGGRLGTEFRCGAWNEPGALGGVRVLNSHNRDFFMLAAQDWSATYGKATRHPLFFEWVDHPVVYWEGLYMSGCFTVGIALVASFALTVTLVLFLNAILNCLIDNAFAAPVDPPMPPSGLSRNLARRLLPGMSNHHDSAVANKNSWVGSDPKYVIL